LDHTTSVNASLVAVLYPVLVAYALANWAASDPVAQVADAVCIPRAKLRQSPPLAAVHTPGATVGPTTIDLALVAVLDIVRARGAPSKEAIR
jgi:hypothetical protein